MKRTQLPILLMVGLAFALTVTGCKSRRPQNITQIPGLKPGEVAGPGPGKPLEPRLDQIQPTDIGIPHGPGHPGWHEDPTLFAAETVYFDFDSSVIKASEKPKIETVAAYLKNNRAHAVKIEGHCDERGTEEYNRALGERRALAVREQLVRLGIAPERIDTISWGEERPVDPGHNEEAWRKNRRGVFVLLTPPR